MRVTRLPEPASQTRKRRAKAQRNALRQHVISRVMDLARKIANSGSAVSSMSKIKVFIDRVQALIYYRENRNTIRSKSATSGLLLCQPSCKAYQCWCSSAATVVSEQLAELHQVARAVTCRTSAKTGKSESKQGRERNATRERERSSHNAVR
jgi:hypothetical protein